MPIYLGDRNRRIGRKNENDNPVRKGCFVVVVSQGNSGNKVGVVIS